MFDNYHILILSNGFPNYFNSLDGIFYLDQAIALKKTYPNLKIGFIAVNPISIKKFIKKPNIFKLGKKIDSIYGVNIHVLSYLNIPFINSYDIKQAQFKVPVIFKEYIAKYGKPNLIHIHGYEVGKAAIALKKNYSIPLVITEHSSKFINNTLGSQQVSLAKEVFSNADFRIAVSNFFAVKLKELFNLSFEVIANVVKFEINSPIACDDKIYDVISVGTFNENKNQMLLLETLKKYKLGKVLLIGEGVNENKIRNYIKTNQLENFVDMIPFQNIKRLFELIKKSKCLAITSHHETFGVVAIEALSCGVPVISTKAGGPSDIIVDGENGYLIENAPDAFYASYKKISENLSKFAPEKLSDYAQNHFSEKAIAQKLLNSYKRILKSQNG